MTGGTSPCRPIRTTTRLTPATLRQRRLRTARPRRLGLHHLLTRRYISAEADADVYSWVLEYRKELSVRLSELDLLLRIVDGTDVAFIEQARFQSARNIKLLRREPLGTYDSILALHLAQIMRATGGQAVRISREEMHGPFSGVLDDVGQGTDTCRSRRIRPATKASGTDAAGQM